MRTIELFCGTKSFSKVAEKLGHETFTVDFEEKFNPDLKANLLEGINDLIYKKINEADIVWLSPPCTTFSMASGNTHWHIGRIPKTKKCMEGMNLLILCKQIADYCHQNNKLFFIENPMARARWFFPVEWRKTVWYCQYGDSRAKPTDIWTNLESWNPKTCKNGNRRCHHEPAPRGSKTGTQGLKNSRDRGVIPEDLFYEIFEVIDNG